MKVVLLTSVLVLNIYFGSTNHDYLDDEQPGKERSLINRKWAEQHFPIETEEQLDGGNREAMNEWIGFNQAVDEDVRDNLFDRNYFRIDSKETKEILSDPVQSNIADELNSHELKQYKAEIAAGDATELFGTNSHYYQPEGYRDFMRRFVLQYPYKVKDSTFNEDAEDNRLPKDNRLTPKLASPELVLAVAKESAMLDSAKPVNPTEHLIQQNMLRTGEYWNTFWKEDVDPDKILLRSSKGNKMESVKAKLSPGTKIYEYVSQLRQPYPQLLYVINKKNF